MHSKAAEGEEWREGRKACGQWMWHPVVPGNNRGSQDRESEGTWKPRKLPYCFCPLFLEYCLALPSGKTFLKSSMGSGGGGGPAGL